MKHLFQDLKADDSMSKENGRGPPLVSGLLYSSKIR